MSGYGWAHRNVCGQTDPELFYAPDGAPELPRSRATREREAKSICVRLCPVREQCLAWAAQMERGASLDMRHGVWGGTSPRERYSLDRYAQGPACEDMAGTRMGIARHRRVSQELCPACEVVWGYLPSVLRASKNDELAAEALDLRAQGESSRRIGARLRVHPSTVDRWFRLADGLLPAQAVSHEGSQDGIASVGSRETRVGEGQA